MLFHCRVSPSINLSVPMYTPGSSQVSCPRTRAVSQTGFKLRPLDLSSSMLTPLHHWPLNSRRTSYLIRLVFTQVWKVICVYFGFELLHLAIGLKNLCHFLIQTEVKPKPITCKTKTNCDLLVQVSLHFISLYRVLIGQWIALYPL